MTAIDEREQCPGCDRMVYSWEMKMCEGCYQDFCNDCIPDTVLFCQDCQYERVNGYAARP